MATVYTNTLGREADAAGLAAWTSALDQGMSRGTMMLGFSDATEFQTLKAGEVDVILASMAVSSTVPETATITTRAALSSQMDRLQYALNDRALSVSASGTTLTVENTPSGDAGVTFDISAGTITDGSTSVAPTGVTLTSITTISAENLSGIMTLTAGSNAITATTGYGADVIVGSAGADTISSGSGADTITGGVGSDTMSGGSGNDIFVFSTAATTSATFVAADTTTGLDAEQITITADNTDDGDETLTVTYTLGSTQATTASIAAGIDVTTDSTVATAVAALLDAVSGITSTASNAIVTASADSESTLTIDSISIGGTTVGLAGAIADSSTDAAELDTFTVGGTIAVGDDFSITISGLGTASYTAVSGDDTSQVVSGLVSAVNSESTLSTAVTAASTGTTTLTITDDNIENGGFGAVTVSVGGANDAVITGTTGGDTISDYSSGDIIRMTAANNVAGTSSASGTTATNNVEISSGGKVTFASADDTLAEMLVAVAADNTDIASNEVVFFVLSSDTYIYGAGGDTTGSQSDFLIKLTGLSSLTTLTESTTTAGDFTIA